MALTVIGIREKDGEMVRTNLYVSQEYLPHKDCDERGIVLADQEWQHPDAETLRYCFAGALEGDGRVESLLSHVLESGGPWSGGHLRVLFPDNADWIMDQLESWESRWQRERGELEAHHAAHRAQESERRERATPIYGPCPKCGGQTEQCKGLKHRGTHRCGVCCGGIMDHANRYCANCLDLPYREKREAALGEPIIYSGEEL